MLQWVVLGMAFLGPDLHEALIFICNVLYVFIQKSNDI